MSTKQGNSSREEDQEWVVIYLNVYVCFVFFSSILLNFMYDSIRARAVVIFMRIDETHLRLPRFRFSVRRVN